MRKIDAAKIGAIVEIVARHHGISVDQVLAGGSARDARRIAIFLTRELVPGLSLPQIGKQLGGLSSTNVLFAIRKIGRRIADDPKFAGEIVVLRDQMGKEHPAGCRTSTSLPPL